MKKWMCGFEQENRPMLHSNICIKLQWQMMQFLFFLLSFLYVWSDLFEIKISKRNITLSLMILQETIMTSDNIFIVQLFTLKNFLH
jgi:lysylphosphatidylglycerol synthetase-like protein (DUF2156 family)